MRILSIITNQLIVKKQILENELERTLNSNKIGTEEQTHLSIEIVAKLAEINSTILTWESYISKEQQKQN